MRFRRCRVVRGHLEQWAWVPLARAVCMAKIDLVTGDREDTWIIVELDQLVVPGHVLAHCENARDLPAGAT